MVRAVVVQPAVCDFYHTWHRNAGLGARAVARLLGSVGRSVDLIVASARRIKPRRLPLPDALSHLVPYILPSESGPTSFFRHYQRFGPEPRALAGEIMEKRPDEVYISLFAWAYAEEAVLLAKALRLQPRGADVRIVLGGAGASVWPQYFDGTLPATWCACEPGLFDEVVVGEAELRLSLADNTAGGGAATGKARVVAHEPTWAVVADNAHTVTVALSVTRGCPRRCRFCSNHLAHGASFRLPTEESLARTIEEITRVAAGKRLRLNIEDDNILYAPELLLWLVQRVGSAVGSFEFSCENGLDYRLLDGNLATKLAGFGLRRVNLSLGDMSGDRPLDRLVDVLCTARRLGIEAVTYVIAGMPRSTVRAGTVLRTLAAQPTEIGVSPYYPVRGLADSPADTLLASVSPALTSGSACYPWGDLSTAELVTTFRAARCINALKADPASDLARAILDKQHILTTDSGGRIYRPPNIDNEIEHEAFADGIAYN